jgi:hypothetical protein
MASLKFPHSSLTPLRILRPLQELFFSPIFLLCFFPLLELPRRTVPRLMTELRALPIPGPITNLSWSQQVYILLRIEDTVCYLTLIGKHALPAPSRLHYCDNACCMRFLSADFTQCPCGALLQRSCGREIMFTC